MPAASAPDRIRRRSPWGAPGRLAAAVLLVLSTLAILTPAILTPAILTPAAAGAEAPGATMLAASGGTISGRATRADGKGAAGVQVAAFEAVPSDDGYWLDWAGVTTVTDANGEYVLTFARDAQYLVWFGGTHGEPWAPFVPQYYDGTRHGTHDGYQARRFTVADGVAVTGIDIDLVSEQTEWVSITGQVTDPEGAPLADVEVNAYCPDQLATFTHWRFCRTALTDATGHYTVEMLSRGEYRLGFTDLEGRYPPEYYDDVEEVSLGTSIFSAEVGETITMPVVRMGSEDPDGDPLTMEVAPSIDGTPAVGQTLSLDRGRWSPGPVAFTFQWLRAGTPIAGANRDRYVSVPADRGAVLTVRVTATVATGSRTVVTAGVRVRPGTLSNFVAPVINGPAVVGRTLRLVRGDWGPDPVTLKIQWLRNGRPVVGGTGSTYRVARADRRKFITARVTASKPGYRDLTLVAKSQRVR